MDWSTLLGAVVGASAGIIGSFVSSWAQSRKERLAFNRDKVIAASIKFLQRCDALYEAASIVALFESDHEDASDITGYEPVYGKEQVALDAVKSSLTRLSLLCPRASVEAQALYEAAKQIERTDMTLHQETDDFHGTVNVYDLKDETKHRYESAKSAFVARIRKLADL